MEGMLGALDILFSGGAYWLGCVCPPGPALLFCSSLFKDNNKSLDKEGLLIANGCSAAAPDPTVRPPSLSDQSCEGQPALFLNGTAIFGKLRFLSLVI